MNFFRDTVTREHGVWAWRVEEEERETSGRRGDSWSQGDDGGGGGRDGGTSEDGEEGDGDRADAALFAAQQQIRELTEQLAGKSAKIDKFEKQQRKLYDGFKLLRSKYDELKADMAVALWEYIPAKVKVFRDVERTNMSIFESETAVGSYKIGALLGTGQFANVHVSTNDKIEKKLAVKIMKKDKVHSVQSLKRVQNEIGVLKKIRHENIIKFVDVIFTAKYVYLFVEMGGQDLFDFFDCHLDGVSASVAREIMLGITLPIAYLHERGICHRDLKPENILLKVKGGEAGDVRSEHIQLCDFGLCRQGLNETDKSLTEFCGSPGFFAPEIVTGEQRYNGLAVDVWSIGCIMLELCLGHEQFCTDWMVAYDFDLIQRPFSFEDAIDEAVSRLELGRSMDEEMEDFARGCLTVLPDERARSRELVDAAWFVDHTKIRKIKERVSSSPDREEEQKDGAIAIPLMQLSEPNSPLPYRGEESKEGGGWASARSRTGSTDGDMIRVGSERDMAMMNKIKQKMLKEGNSGEEQEEGGQDKFKDCLSLRARRHFEAAPVETGGAARSACLGSGESSPSASESSPLQAEAYLGAGVVKFPPVNPGSPNVRFARRMAGGRKSPTPANRPKSTSPTMGNVGGERHTPPSPLLKRDTQT